MVGVWLRRLPSPVEEEDEIGDEAIRVGIGRRDFIISR